MKEYHDSFTGFKPKLGKVLIGAYKLAHVETGKFYVGSSGNIEARLKNHQYALRKTAHHVEELQRLYIQSPHFTYEVYLTGVAAGTGHDVDAREKAYDEEQTLLTSNWGNPKLLNYSSNARYSQLFGERKDKHTEVLRKLRRSDAARQQQSKIATSLWATPEYREKMMSVRFSDEKRAEISENNKRRWEDPAFREKALSHLQSPEWRARVSESRKLQGKKVRVDGVDYINIQSARKTLGIKANTVVARCNSEKFPNYQWVGS